MEMMIENDKISINKMYKSLDMNFTHIYIYMYIYIYIHIYQKHEMDIL